MKSIAFWVALDILIEFGMDASVIKMWPDLISSTAKKMADNNFHKDEYVAAILNLISSNQSVKLHEISIECCRTVQFQLSKCSEHSHLRQMDLMKTRHNCVLSFFAIINYSMYAFFRQLVVTASWKRLFIYLTSSNLTLITDCCFSFNHLVLIMYSIKIFLLFNFLWIYRLSNY